MEVDQINRPFAPGLPPGRVCTVRLLLKDVPKACQPALSASVAPPEKLADGVLSRFVRLFVRISCFRLFGLILSFVCVFGFNFVRLFVWV